MDNRRGSEDQPAPANRLPSRTRKLLATAATLALAACASSPSVNGDKPAHSHAASAKPHSETKKPALTPEAKSFNETSQLAAENLANKILTFYEDSPTKYTFREDYGKKGNFKTGNKDPNLTGVFYQRPTGETFNGKDLNVHVSAVMQSDTVEAATGMYKNYDKPDFSTGCADC